VLQRLHVAARRVVDDEHDAGGADPARRFQVPERHVEAAVARQRRDAPLRPDAELRADRARQPVADGGKAAVGHVVPPARLVS
jgi:hypothetical protein